MFHGGTSGDATMQSIAIFILHSLKFQLSKAYASNKFDKLETINKPISISFTLLVHTIHYPYALDSSVFFPYVKKKVPVKTVFGILLIFFTGTFRFSRPLFGPFFKFFTPTIFFSWAVFSFFSREENHFSRAKNLIFFILFKL